MYFQMDGGSFEAGSASGWSLNGGASVSGPNEPWSVNGSNDSASLGIPNGASATSSPICVTAKSPALRLFEVNTGGANRPLQIFVNYTGTDGKPHSAKLQDQQNSGFWATTQQVRFVDKIQDVLNRDGKATVTFTFLSPYQNGRPGNWRIDDVYVDDTAGICNWSGFFTPFTPWNDSNPYFVADGGSFEGDVGTGGWSLTGGAAVGSPNEPWHVNGSADFNSLAIPNGASATSPSVCVTASSPALRLFYVNTGGTDRPLQVSINYNGTDGKRHSQKLQDQKTGSSWSPSPSIPFLATIQGVLTQSGQTMVTFTFTSPFQKDHPGNWRIDDVEIDPLKSQ